MFFGRRTSKSAPLQEAKEKAADPLFTNGRVVLTDGSAVEVAELEQNIERTAFVPLSFTQSKVSEVVFDLEKMKVKYEEHVVRLKEFYEKALAGTKSHYETYILDLKSKAMKHVELERMIRNQMEVEMSIQLKVSEDKIEELRDTLAASNLEAQEKIRELKRQITVSDQNVTTLTKAVTSLS